MSGSSLFRTFAKGTDPALTTKGTNCVIYTRVSSKEQADKNLSLETQQKACNLYAQKHGYNILEHFGGTYESAQTDERKEFTAMISYVKRSKSKVSYILVYSLERFSRNDNSIWLTNQLRALGIEIVSVTQPIDTSNPSGQLQQKMLFLFGEFDNQLRKQKCVAGMKEMLLRGYWPAHPPMGYDTMRSHGEQKIFINEKGQLIRQAFHWKAHEGLSNEQIRMRLGRMGLRIHKQRLTEIFRNPFYCGLLTHNMLDGQVVEGKHEKMISKTLFLQVNDLIAKHTQGYRVVEENDALPLKRFLHCANCGKMLRGYEVKKKGIHYYKCCTQGCNNNKNANQLNDRFASVLDYFNLDYTSDVMERFIDQMDATYNQMTRDNTDERQLARKRLDEIDKKLDRYEERFMDEEITKEQYKKFGEKLVAEKQEIEKALNMATGQKSNLEKYMGLAINFASKLRFSWVNGDYTLKQNIQFLLFPKGISYDRSTDKCRTTQINSVFLYIAYLQQIISKKRRGIPELNLDYASLSSLVAGAGLEPTTFGL
ncbi:recombinase family protein [Mucilaginibacter oryzae]|uniref:recombinase family protein n=1 Tax=Mucilaginibacter oryzae TaxID=468058 RepID=UPI0038B26677